MAYVLKTAVTAAVPCVLSRARAVIPGGSAPRTSTLQLEHKTQKQKNKNAKTPKIPKTHNKTTIGDNITSRLTASTQMNKKLFFFFLHYSTIKKNSAFKVKGEFASPQLVATVGGISIFKKLQIQGTTVGLRIDIDERNKVYVRMTFFFFFF